MRQRSPIYELSPKPPGQAESHTIPERLRRRTPVKLEKVPGVNEALGYKQSGYVKFDPSKYGRKIGTGAFGTVFRCKVTPSLLEDLKNGLNVGSTNIYSSQPNLGDSVIIKIQLQNPTMSDKEFMANVARENSVHKELTSSPSCYKIPLASRPTCISNYVPKFYLSFVFGTKTRVPKDKIEYRCVTVMDSAGDMSAKEFASMLKGSRYPQLFVNWYLSFEKAVTSLWLAGYVHGDLHRENVMVNSKNGDVKLIDFGFAIKIPQSFVKNIADGASEMIASESNRSFADLWTNKPINGQQTLVDYTNRVMTGRRYKWYNPDYKVLQTMYNDIPKGGKQLIPNMRSSKWEIKRVRKEAPKARIIERHRTLDPRRRPPTLPRKVIEKAPSPSSSLESGEIRVTPVKKKTPWKPINGKYWADEPSPSTYVSAKSTVASPKSPTPVSKRELTPTPKALTPKEPTPKALTPKEPTPKALTPKEPTPKALTPFDKVNAKGRKVFKDEKGRTYVKQDDKKVYVKKLFTPKASVTTAVAPGSPMINTGKVDAKKRKVFKDSKGRTYVKPANKKVFVKKVFTPKANATTASSPSANTGKVDAKKRKVFKNVKGRTYVKQNNKKVYVKKLFTPK